MYVDRYTPLHKSAYKKSIIQLAVALGVLNYLRNTVFYNNNLINNHKLSCKYAFKLIDMFINKYVNLY